MADIFGKSGYDIIAYIGLQGGDKFNQDLNKAGGNVSSFGGLVSKSAVALGAAYAAMRLVGESVSVAAELEKGMANVNTVLRLTPPELEKIKDQLIGIAKETPQEINTLAKGLYDLASSGVAAADSQYALKQAAMAATAGVTTVDTAVRAGMAVINAYGLDVKDLNEVYDLQFKTVEKGVLTYEEYARAIGNVLPSAASLGVSFEDLSASIAQITLAGIDAQSATTYLARAFDEMVGKRDKWEDLGVAIFDASGNFRGMEAVIGDLAGQMEGLTTEQKKMKLETLDMREQGQKAILALVNNYGSFKEIIDETKDSHDAMAGAFKIQMDTFDAQAKLFKTELNVALEGLGSVILPALTVALRETNEAAREWSAFDWIKNAFGGAYFDAYVENAKKLFGLANYIDISKTREAVAGLSDSTREYNEVVQSLANSYGKVGDKPIIPDIAITSIEKTGKSTKDAADHVRTLHINLNNFKDDLPKITGPVESFEDALGTTTSTGLSGAMRGARSQAVLITEPIKQTGEAAETAGKKAKEASKGWADYATYIDKLASQISGGNAAVGSLVNIISTVATGAFDPITLGLQGIGFAVNALNGDNSVQLAGHHLNEMTETLRDMYQPTMDAAAALESFGSQFKSDRLDVLKQQQTLYTQLIDQMSRTSALGAEMAWDRYGDDLERVNSEIEKLTGAFSEKAKLDELSNNMEYLLSNTQQMLETFGEIDNPGLITLLNDAITASETFQGTLDPTSQAFTDIADQIQRARDLLLQISGANPDIVAPFNPFGPVEGYATGGYVPNAGLAMLHGNEFVLNSDAVSALGVPRLERFNAGDAGALGGSRAGAATVVNIIAGNTTPETWYKISDKNIQPRINTRTRKFQVQANPYAQ